MREALHAMIDKSYVALSNPRERVAIERDISIPVSGGDIVLRLYRADTGDDEIADFGRARHEGGHAVLRSMPCDGAVGHEVAIFIARRMR